jgi:arylsulfatase A-like enzyme
VGIAGAICTVSLLLPGSKATTRADDRPNVILLIVDTLRADRLGCYGYERDTSPNIDRIAGKGVLFEQVYVPWASSLPSHTSIFTGLYPSMHGTFPNGNSLDPSMLTLPRILKEYGYTNYAFVTNALVGNDHNFSAGYHTFTDFTKYDYRKSSMTVWLHALNITRVLDKITGNDIFTTLAISHLRSHKKGPFFLWAQWLQPHAPYTPPARFLDKFSEGYSGIADGSLEQIDRINSEELALTEVDKQHYENLYDAEVAFSDYEVGRVIDTIEELGLLENSILIITSDHGENMFEHRLEYGHAGVYESSVRIPLIIVQPGSLKPRRITEVVESIDLMPTLLDMLGIDIDVKFQGVSLMPLIEGGASDWQNAAYSVMLRRDRNFVGIRLDDWKIVLQARKHRQDYELYNVVDDPHERNDVIAQYPQIADSLKSILQAWVDENFLPPEIVYVPGTEFRQEFDAETMARLRSLGYVK